MKIFFVTQFLGDKAIQLEQSETKMDRDLIDLLFGLSLLMLWLSYMLISFNSDKKIDQICNHTNLPPLAPMMVLVTNAGDQNHAEKREYTQIMETIHRAYEIYQERQGHTHPVASQKDRARIRELLSKFEELRWYAMADPLYSDALHVHYVGLMKTLLGERRQPLQITS